MTSVRPSTICCDPMATAFCGGRRTAIISKNASRATALTATAGTIPLSIFLDDLGYKNVQGGAGITVTSGPTYNTISVNGASGGSGFFQTAWDYATTPISTDAMVFGDGGLTGTASTVLFSKRMPTRTLSSDSLMATSTW